MVDGTAGVARAARAAGGGLVAVRFADFLRTTVLISAAAATALAAVTLAGGDRHGRRPGRAGRRRLVGDRRRDRDLARAPAPRPRRRSPRCWRARGRRPRCRRSTRAARCSTGCGRCSCSTIGAGALAFIAAAGAGGRDRVRDHLGARVAPAGLGGDGDRGARRRALLHRADLAAAADPARPDAGLPLEPVRAERRIGARAAAARRRA